MQRLVSTAVHICFGPSMLQAPCIAHMMPTLPEGSSASQCMQLPLLVGAVLALPDEEVAAIQRDSGGGRWGERETRAQLLAWAIGSACPAAQGDSDLQSSDEACLMLEAAEELDLRVRGLADPMPVLQAAFQQVRKPGRALVVVAACLAHAQQGRVGDEEGNTPVQMRATGQLMRVLSRAMTAEGGSGFSALATATRAMQSSGNNGSAPSELTVPNAVIAVAYGAIKMARAEIDKEGPIPQDQSQIRQSALSIGVALHSSGCVELSKGISQALVLAYSPAWRLPLQAAVAAVAESMAPGGPGVELVMQLMGEMRQFIP